MRMIYSSVQLQQKAKKHVKIAEEQNLLFIMAGARSGFPPENFALCYVAGRTS